MCLSAAEKLKGIMRIDPVRSGFVDPFPDPQLIGIP